MGASTAPQKPDVGTVVVVATVVDVVVDPAGAVVEVVVVVIWVVVVGGRLVEAVVVLVLVVVVDGWVAGVVLVVVVVVPVMTRGAHVQFEVHCSSPGHPSPASHCSPAPGSKIPSPHPSER